MQNQHSEIPRNWYNIGNVGNNDRGDRIAYNNPYNGARLNCVDTQ